MSGPARETNEAFVAILIGAVEQAAGAIRAAAQTRIAFDAMDAAESVGDDANTVWRRIRSLAACRLVVRYDATPGDPTLWFFDVGPWQAPGPWTPQDDPEYQLGRLTALLGDPPTPRDDYQDTDAYRAGHEANRWVGRDRG